MRTTVNLLDPEVNHDPYPLLAELRGVAGAAPGG